MRRFEEKVICHITSVHIPLDVRIFHKQCKTLSATGFNVVLVATGDGNDKEINGVRVVFVNRPKNRIKRVFITSFMVVRRALLERPDVIQMHDPELLPYALVLAVLGKKIIFDFHEDVEMKLHERRWLPKPLRTVAAMVFRLMSRTGDKLFSAVLTATPTIAARHTGKRVRVIANYPVAHLTQGGLSEKIYKADNYGLIYTGGWTENRGVRQLVEAMGYVLETKAMLTVIGQKALNEYKVASQLTGFYRVVDLGRVSYDESITNMRAAAVGLVCSQYGHGYDNALPNKLFEYMALGLPVIASDFSLWKQLLEKEDCVIFVNPAQPEEIAKAIDFLLANPDRRKVMGENGRRAIRERFSWEREGERLIGIYEDIL